MSEQYEGRQFVGMDLHRSPVGAGTEATYGWYWAAGALAELGASVHLAHPLGVKGFSYRRVKTMNATPLIWLISCG